MIKTMIITPEFLQDLSAIYNISDPIKFLEGEYIRLFGNYLKVIVFDETFIDLKLKHHVYDEVVVAIKFLPQESPCFKIEWKNK